VALDKMAAETPVRREGTFKIDAAFLAQRLQICAIESLSEEIEGKLFLVMGRDREAATVHGDAVADLDSLGDKRRDDLKLRTPIRRLDSEDAADFFDQAGKHELIVHRLTQMARIFPGTFAVPGLGKFALAEGRHPQPAAERWAAGGARPSVAGGTFFLA
jgi:hypothetical protein